LSRQPWSHRSGSRFDPFINFEQHSFPFAFRCRIGEAQTDCAESLGNHGATVPVLALIRLSISHSSPFAFRCRIGETQTDCAESPAVTTLFLTGVRGHSTLLAANECGWSWRNFCVLIHSRFLGSDTIDIDF
jgi:hypothetical protein